MKQSWKFDKDFLEEIIETGQEMLKKDDIPVEKKDLITATVLKFSEFLSALNNNYVDPELNNDFDLDMNSIKNRFLAKAKKDYEKYCDEFIDFIIAFDEECTELTFDDEIYQTDDTPERIVENSLNIYKEFFPDFYETAKDIIDCPLSLINFSKNGVIESQCYYERFLELPFMHVGEYDKNPTTFIHELQHGVEWLQKYDSDIYFKELGSILMETLYIDKMAERGEDNASLLYFERIKVAEQYLRYLANYFRILVRLNAVDYNIDSNEFLNLLCINEDIADFTYMLNIDCDECLTYLMSFWKSLEIRQSLYRDKKFGAYKLNKTLTEGEVYYDDYDLLEYYNDYLNEIITKNEENQYTKKKRK